MPAPPTDTISETLADAAANVGPEEVTAAIRRAETYFEVRPHLATSVVQIHIVGDLKFSDIFALLVAAKSAQGEVG